MKFKNLLLKWKPSRFDAGEKISLPIGNLFKFDDVLF